MKWLIAFLFIAGATQAATYTVAPVASTDDGDRYKSGATQCWGTNFGSLTIGVDGPYTPNYDVMRVLLTIPDRERIDSAKIGFVLSDPAGGGRVADHIVAESTLDASALTAKTTSYCTGTEYQNIDNRTFTSTAVAWKLNATQNTGDTIYSPNIGTVVNAWRGLGSISAGKHLLLKMVNDSSQCCSGADTGFVYGYSYDNASALVNFVTVFTTDTSTATTTNAFTICGPAGVTVLSGPAGVAVRSRP